MLIRAQIADETSAPSDRQALNIGPELQRIYQDRFAATRQYRDKIWEVLTADFFSYYISEEDIILDLGSGYGEFINHIRTSIQTLKKYCVRRSISYTKTAPHLGKYGIVV